LRNLHEPRLFDLEFIQAIGQALQSQSALVIGAEGAPILVCLAVDLNRGFHPETEWISHPEPQLAAVALSNKKQGTREDKNDKFHKPADSVSQRKCPKECRRSEKRSIIEIFCAMQLCSSPFWDSRVPAHHAEFDV